MMRLTSLAVWAHKLSPDELYEAVKLQTSLTHPHEVPITTSYLYCYAIRLILKGKTSAEDIYDMTLHEADRIAMKTGMSTVKYWMENTIDIDEIDEMPNASERPYSFVKTPFLWALYYLKKDFSYHTALSEII